jgi:two-component system chemotaxis sensor kinase CheA
VIELTARHEGNHVLVEIRDDGRGLDPEKIGAKAVERGMITEQARAEMGRNEILNLIFAAGFSTAAAVSDLSGRGVGMDVVRTNIAKLNGLVDVDSETGRGTRVSIRIPLTVAIMPAMIVEVRRFLYAVPLTSIVEIVRAGPAEQSQVGGQATLRLRNEVLPLVNLGELFGGEPAEAPSAIAVVVGLGEQRMGLLVDGLVGQQEVVIKPLDDMFNRSGAVSGATVREDGGVSLILDVAALVKMFGRRNRQAA